MTYLPQTGVPQDQIRRGFKEGAGGWNKFSYRTGVASASGEVPIWAASSTSFTILTTASTFTITYNSSTDGDGTTGALTLLIDYIDENFALQQLAHTLGSTGSDVTTVTGLGINRVVVTSSGSANRNTNDIDITATTGGSEQAVVPALQSVTQQLIFHFPTAQTGVAKVLFLHGNKTSGGSSPKITFKVWVYNRLVETQYEVFRYTMDTAVENTLIFEDPQGFVFGGRDVVWVTMDTDTNSTDASARLSFNIYDDTIE